VVEKRESVVYLEFSVRGVEIAASAAVRAEEFTKVIPSYSDHNTMQEHRFLSSWPCRILGSLVLASALSLAFGTAGRAAPISARVWSGGAFPLTNWDNRLNWVGSRIPKAGDDVVFPSDAPGMTNFNDLSVGTTFNSITLGGPGYLLFSGTPFVLSAGIVSTNTAGANTIAGALVINSNSCIISNTAGGALVFAGTIDLNGQELALANAGNLFVFNSISNSGGLVKSGSGTLQLAGSNSYDGVTRVLEGRIIALDNDALGSLAGDTIVAAGAELQILNGRVVAEPLRLAGTLSSGLSANNTWAGSITLLDLNALMAVNSGGTLRISGLVDGSGGFRKTQGGDLTLAADNTYTGPTVIESGNLFINGVQPSSAITVAPGGVLGGQNGHCGSVSNAPFGAIYLGDAGPLTLHIDGGLTCVPFSQVFIDIFDGVGSDQLIVTGPADLGGARLGVGFASLPLPPADAAFELISNDGTDAVVGTFAGLPEGGVYYAGHGIAFRITYAGGDGNDVVLTRVSEPTTIRSIACLTNKLKQIQGVGLPFLNYVLEATPNLDTPILWLPLATNMANGAGVYQFIDEDSLILPMRFYRVLSP
jgi:autotransporter-associated beta strand protein